MSLLVELPPEQTHVIRLEEQSKEHPFSSFQISSSHSSGGFLNPLPQISHLFGDDESQNAFYSNLHKAEQPSRSI